jgi:aminomethyltransferase
VIDDQIIYRLGENDFYMVVNAGTQDNDFQWIESHLSSSTGIENLSAQTAKIDLQGPGSARIMQTLMSEPIVDMKYYHFKYNNYHNKRLLTSRTGYTGELGFEIYFEHDDLALSFWDACLKLGAKPAGLGARDTLRLEMGLPLYGHELNEKRNAAESGFFFAIASDKRFIGSEIVSDHSRRKEALISALLNDRRAGRHGDFICDTSGNEIGVVTSGSFAPSLAAAIIMGYVKKDYAASGTKIKIKTGRNELSATVAKPPLYKNATGRKQIKEFI